MGKRVVINGLAAKPELNGRTGTVLSFDDAEGRYFVELDLSHDETSTSFTIKPCNLTVSGQQEQAASDDGNSEVTQEG